MEQQEGTERQTRRERQSSGNAVEKTKLVIDAIEKACTQGRSVPFKKDLSIVNAAEIIDLLGQLRIVLPKSIQDALEVMENSGSIIEQARRQADEYQDQVNKTCRTAIEEANKASEQIRRDADEYDRRIRAQAESSANARLQDAEICAAKIIEDATRAADEKLSENEIVRRANAYANEMRDNAQRDAEAIYNQACVQVDKMLSGAAAALSRSAGEMAAARDKLLGIGQQPNP